MKQNVIYYVFFVVVMLFPFKGIATITADETDKVFAEDFNSQEDFDKWEAVNPNEGTAKTWIFYTSKGNGQARILKDVVAHDNWLISPVFNLEKDKVYELSCYVYSGVFNKKERLKITLGNARTIDAQTKELLNLVDFERGNETHQSQRFSVETSGEYSMALYAYSEANQGRIEVDSIYIKELSSGSVPDSVYNLSAIAAPNGELKATVSFNCPSTTSKGDNLSSLSYVKLSRDGELIKTFSEISPGTPLEYIDSEAKQGYNTYDVTAANADGEGETKSVKVYVGLDVPTNVKNLTASRNKDLSVSIKWNAPVSSQHGGFFDKASLKYNILLDDEIIANTTETEYAYKPTDKEQREYSFKVVPVAELGNGTDTLSNNVISGEPIKAPYCENFVEGSTTSCGWITDNAVSDYDWEPATTDDIGVESPDNDGYMLMADTYYAFNGQMGRVMSPIMNLADMQNPVFKFSLYQRKADDEDMYGKSRDAVKLQVSVDGGEWEDVNNGTFSPYSNVSSGWTACKVPLLKYDGSNVQFAFDVVLDSDDGSHHYIFIDDVSVADAGFTKNIALRSFSADRKRVNIGEETKFRVKVYNNGNSTATPYNVVLYRNGMEEQRISNCSTVPTECSEYEFNVVSTLADSRTDGIKWTAAVELDGDEVADDNASDEISWSVRKNNVEIPLNLQATLADNAIKLAWNGCESKAAVYAETAEPITDDFESYEPFIIDNIGEWTVVDKDGGATLNSPVIPTNYPHKGEPMAWQIFNTTESGVITEDHYDNVFQSRSGVQYIMCTSNDDYYKTNDDWLISPRLDGKEQTISFYARTPNSASGADRLKVYYSTTDKDTDSFVELGESDHIAVWDWWNKDAYTYTLPEGTRYFAIRCVRCFLYCMIDDITYRPYNGDEPAQTLLGYNLYRDGEKINTSLITDIDYIDYTAEKDKSVTYNVTAVYEEGESDFSNDASALLSSISQVKSDATLKYSYTVSGIRSAGSSKGLLIQKMNDGTTRKVVIR